MFTFEIQILSSRRNVRTIDGIDVDLMDLYCDGRYHRRVIFKRFMHIYGRWILEEYWELKVHFDRNTEYGIVEKCFEILLNAEKGYDEIIEALSNVKEFSIL